MNRERKRLAPLQAMKDKSSNQEKQPFIEKPWIFSIIVNIAVVLVTSIINYTINVRTFEENKIFEYEASQSQEISKLYRMMELTFLYKEIGTTSLIQNTVERTIKYGIDQYGDTLVCDTILKELPIQDTAYFMYPTFAVEGEYFQEFKSNLAYIAEHAYLMDDDIYFAYKEILIVLRSNEIGLNELKFKKSKWFNGSATEKYLEKTQILFKLLNQRKTNI